MLHVRRTLQSTYMTSPTEPPRGHSLLRFLVRALLPVVSLGGSLLVLTTLLAGGDPTEYSTLLLRIAGGLLLSGAAITMVLLRARQEAAARHAPALDETRHGDLLRVLAMGATLWLVPAIIAFTTFAVLGIPLTINGSLEETLTVVLLVFGAVLLSEAVPEELVFRGLLMSVLSERIQGWWVILVQAGLFTAFALVLRGWTGVADFSLFVGMGIGLGYLRVVSGSVWTTVGFHAAFQTGSQLVLTHDVITFDGSATAAMVALGAVPFTVGAIAAALLAPKYPYLFVK